MPVYEYECSRCQQTFTRRMRVDEHDRELPTCPKCEQNDQVDKKITAAFVITERKS